MSVPKETIPTTAADRARRLRIVGALVLLLGLTSAGVVYWRGTRLPDASDDMSMSGFDRAQRRQMAQLYGKSGAMIQDLSDSLKRPDVQAGIIAAITVVVAGGCFYFAPFAGISRGKPAEPDAN